MLQKPLINFKKILWIQCQGLLPAFWFFSSLLLSRHLPSSFPLLPYDFLSVSTILFFILELLFYRPKQSRLLTGLIFHLLGLSFEWFKVSKGAWSYDDFAYLKWLGVPLYSGFMYAALANYLSINLETQTISIKKLPKGLYILLLNLLVYCIFFSNEFLPWSVRLVSLGLIILLFFKSHIHFSFTQKTIHGAFLFPILGVLIYLAENVATLFHAWRYPFQSASWHFVDPKIIISWSNFSLLPISLWWGMEWFFKTINNKRKKLPN